MFIRFIAYLTMFTCFASSLFAFEDVKGFCFDAYDGVTTRSFKVEFFTPTETKGFRLEMFDVLHQSLEKQSQKEFKKNEGANRKATLHAVRMLATDFGALKAAEDSGRTSNIAFLYDQREGDPAKVDKFIGYVMLHHDLNVQGKGGATVVFENVVISSRYDRALKSAAAHQIIRRLESVYGKIIE